MNRKTILLGTLILGVICCGSVAAWGIYSLVNNPSVRAGLKQAGNEFSAMSALQQKLAQTYQCQNVSVQLMNGKALNISLINSDFNDQSTLEQTRSAEEVARFVRSNYTGKAKLTHIVIIFVEQMTLGPLNTHRSFSYPFEVEKLDKFISTDG